MINESVNNPELNQDSPSQDSSDVNNNNSFDPNNSEAPAQTAAKALADLDRMEKFRFEGREMTLQELKNERLRFKDYTQKTQGLAKDRESFDSERKFYENLYTDLNFVKNNLTQQNINQFLQVYPEKFHPYLKQVLNGQQPSQAASQSPTPDIETLSRLQKIEKTFQEQETAKYKSEIDSNMTELSKKYPDALPELVLSRVYDAHSKGIQVTKDLWEEQYKAVDAQMKDMVKAKYNDYVKKQTQANQRGRADEAGGGTPGRAPAKFKTLSDVTKYAIEDLTRKP